VTCRRMRIVFAMAFALMAMASPPAFSQPGESGDKDEDALFYRRLLKVKNASEEKAIVSVQYRTFVKDTGKWVWLPVGAPQLAAAETFVIDPGQELDLMSIDVPISASRIRISAESDNLAWNTHRDLDLWIVPEIDEGEHRYKAAAMESFTYFLMGPEIPSVVEEKGEPAGMPGAVEQPRNSKFEFAQPKTIVLRPAEDDAPQPFILEKQAALDAFPALVVPELEPGMELVREADLAAIDFRVDPLSGAFSGMVENRGPKTYRGGRRWSVLRARGPGAAYETILQGWISPMTMGGRFRVWGSVAGLGEGNRFIFAISAGDATEGNDALGLVFAPPLRADLAITDLRIVDEEVSVEISNLGPGDYPGGSRIVTIADQQHVMTRTRSLSVGPLARGEAAIFTFRVRPNTAANNVLMARLNLGDRNVSNDFRDLRIDAQLPIGRLADVRVDRIELDGRTLRGFVVGKQAGLMIGNRQVLLSYETLGAFPRRSLASAELVPLAEGAAQELRLTLPFDPAKVSFRANLSLVPSGSDADPTNDFRSRIFSAGPAPANAFDLAVGNINQFGNSIVASIANVGSDPFPGVATWTLDAMAGKAAVGQLAKGTINALNPAQTMAINAPVTLPAGTTDVRLSIAVQDFNPSNNVGFFTVAGPAPQLAIANLRQSGSQLLWSFQQSPATGALQGQWSYELAVNNVRIGGSPQVSAGPVAVNLSSSTGSATVRLFNRIGIQRHLIDTKTVTLDDAKGGIGSLSVVGLTRKGNAVSWNFELSPANSRLIGAWTYDVLLDNTAIATSRSATAGAATFDLPLPPGGLAPSGVLTINVYQGFGLGNSRTLKDTKSIQIASKPGAFGSLVVVNPTLIGNKLTWTFAVNPPNAQLSPGWVWGVNQASPITAGTDPIDGIGSKVVASMIGPVQQAILDPSKGNQVQVRIMQFGKGQDPVVDRAFPTQPLTFAGGGKADAKVVVNDARIEGLTLKWTFTLSPPGGTLAAGKKRSFSILQGGIPIPNAGGPIDALIGQPQQFVVDPTKGNGFQIRVEEIGVASVLRAAFPTIPLQATGGGKADAKVVVNDARIEGLTLKWTFTLSPPGGALAAGKKRTFSILQGGVPIPNAGGPIDALIGQPQQFVVDPAKGNGFQVRVEEIGAASVLRAAFPTIPLQATAKPPVPSEADLAVTEAKLDPATKVLSYTIANLGPADYAGNRNVTLTGPFGTVPRGNVPPLKNKQAIEATIDLTSFFNAAQPNQKFSATVSIAASPSDNSAANDKRTSNAIDTAPPTKKGSLEVGLINYNRGTKQLSVTVVNNTGDFYPARFAGGLTSDCRVKVRILENGKEREVPLGTILTTVQTIPPGGTAQLRPGNVGNLAPNTLIRVEINGPGLNVSKDQVIP
jgi:hypothetical protein